MGVEVGSQCSRKMFFLGTAYNVQALYRRVRMINPQPHGDGGWVEGSIYKNMFFVMICMKYPYLCRTIMYANPPPCGDGVEWGQFKKKFFLGIKYNFHMCTEKSLFLMLHTMVWGSISPSFFVRN